MTNDNAIVAQAIEIVKKRLREPGAWMGNTSAIERFLLLKYAELEIETFSVTFLDKLMRLIAHETLFKGTLTSVSIYPREIIKCALKHNASYAILSHNHPSGDPTPSDTDFSMTARLTEMLGVVDIKVLDHFVIGGRDLISFAQKGYL
jgi:DNA repair protein RadC